MWSRTHRSIIWSIKKNQFNHFHPPLIKLYIYIYATFSQNAAIAHMYIYLLYIYYCIQFINEGLCAHRISFLIGDVAAECWLYVFVSALNKCLFSLKCITKNSHTIESIYACAFIYLCICYNRTQFRLMPQYFALNN